MALATCLVLAACGGSPSERDARAEFEARLHEAMGPVASFTVDEFRKTNGRQSSSLFGGAAYLVEYAATVTFPQGFRPECVPMRESGAFVSWNCWFLALEPIAGSGPPTFQALFARPGESLTVRGSMSFAETERGWRGPSGAIY